MPSKQLTASYLLDPSGVKKGVDQADQHLSGLTRSMTNLENSGKSSFGRLGSALSGSFGGALGPITEVGSKINDVIKGIGTHMDGLTASGAGMGQKVGAGLAGIGTSAALAGGSLMLIGAGAKQGQQQLKVAIEDTGGSFDDYAAKVDEAHAHLRKFASGKEVDDALATLTINMKDPAKALAALNEVADIAAAKHKTLGEAATLVGKAYANPTRLAKLFGDQVTSSATSTKAAATAGKAHESALGTLARAQQTLADMEARDAVKKKLTIADQQALTKAHEAVAAAQAKVAATTAMLTMANANATTATQSFDGVMRQIGKQTSGQLNASTGTLKGTLAGLKNTVEENVSAFGNKYGPAITAAGAGMGLLGAGIEGASKIMGRFKTVEEAGAVATEGVTVAEGGAAVGAWAMLGPILLVIAAVALLALAGYEVVQHWRGVGEFFLGLWHGIETTVAGLPGRLASIGSGMWDWIVAAFKGSINQLIDLWDALHFTVPSFSAFGQTIGGGTIGMPSIPHLAAGGDVKARPGGMLALLGEAGHDERVTPLDGRSGGGPQVIELHNHVYLDGRQVSETVHRHLLDKGTVNGGLFPSFIA